MSSRYCEICVLLVPFFYLYAMIISQAEGCQKMCAAATNHIKSEYISDPNYSSKNATFLLYGYYYDFGRIITVRYIVGIFK